MLFFFFINAIHGFQLIYRRFKTLIQDTFYEEAKTIIKKKQKRRWLQQHPEHSKNDPYYLLSRTEQVCIVRLRTGDSRLRHHMHTKFRIGESSLCPCGTTSMTVEHLLQDCPTHQNLRTKICLSDQPLREKLYGFLENLQWTAVFISESGVGLHI